MPIRLDARLAGDLFFFRALIEAGGFAKAGDRLAVTQSAVTQRIQRLEQRLGYPLLVRGTREIRLTAEGHDLFAAARSGFDGMGEALLRAERREGRETLRISCIPSLASEWLAPRLKAFSDVHPDIDVAVFGETHELDSARMALAGIDVAVRYGPAPPPGAAVVFDHPEPVYPVCSPAYRSAAAAKPDGAVVLLHDATPWEAAATGSEEWDRWIKLHGAPWDGRIQNLYFNLAQLALRASLGGSGIALGRSLIVAPYRTDGRLVPACGEAVMGGLRYFVLVRALPPAGPAAAFVEWLALSMAGPPSSADPPRAGEALGSG
ncbi:LysR family transcriptional regulator [Methylobacterium radiotolerans]|uniref:LysR substrate-binding domain-containing protein n=1 Tax=Methylobacterium TaxID=407 RepID=UPI002F305509